MNLSPEIISQLRPETLKALLEVYEEKSKVKIEEDGIKTIDEDWELSQFWYTKETSDKVMNLIMKFAAENNFKNIALLCTPSLYRAYLRIKERKREDKSEFDCDFNVKVFEFDKRFQAFGDDYVFYDVNKPLDLDETHKNSYDILVVDPPFLSVDIALKASATIKFLRREEKSAVIFLTGLIMEKHICAEFNNLKLTKIKIEHEGLNNPFGLFSTVDLEGEQ